MYTNLRLNNKIFIEAKESQNNEEVKGSQNIEDQK